MVLPIGLIRVSRLTMRILLFMRGLLGFTSGSGVGCECFQLFVWFVLCLTV